MNSLRIGHGYDVHRLSDERDLVLGGVKIDGYPGLLGHSDADVLLHAIMDAILGAAALGDIGKHFSDKNNEYCGISSLELLGRVAKMIDEAGYDVVNVDSTVILQSPKIASHIDAMRSNIAKALSIDSDRVSVKATTEEGLGFTGTSEGAAAHAIVLLEKRPIAPIRL